MRAIRYDEYGDYDVLKVVDEPKPEPGEGEILVRMTAAAVNPFDNTCRRGWVAAVPVGMIQGNEGVGIVEVGNDAHPVGSRVMLMGAYGFARSGTWQDYVTAGPTDATQTPENLTDIEAAAAPIAYVAAEMALRHGIGLEPGMSLLIPGVGGSVGNAAIQLARIHGAGRVITSAGRTEKADHARAQGYDDVIDLSKESLSAGVMRLTDGKGVDAALDSVGGDITGEALKSLVPGGRVIQMGYPGGTALTLDSITLIWGAHGTGPSPSVHGFNIYFQPPDAYAAAWGVLLPLLRAGGVKPAIAKTFPLEDAAAATRHLIEDRPFGKVVLTM